MHKVFKIEFGKFRLYREKLSQKPIQEAKTPPTGDTYSNCIFGQTITSPLREAGATKTVDIHAIVEHVEEKTGLNPELIERVLTVASDYLGSK